MTALLDAAALIGAGAAVTSLGAFLLAAWLAPRECVDFLAAIWEDGPK